MACERTLRRLLNDESGQDLIEYALLCAFIGFAGATVFSTMGGTMQVAYTSWVDAADAAADMPEPLP
jgi:Flp pilus assembly pilin Flp